MNITRFVQIGATLAALVAVSLGLGTYSNADLTPLHIGFGVVVTLALLVLSLMAVLTGELRRLGVVGIIYALLLPLFGATHAMIWPGDWHWLVQAAHLMVSFGAIPFIDNLRRRYMNLKRPAANVSGQPQPVR